MIRGQALRYAGWQIWDRTGPRLLASLLIVAFICLPLHFAVRHSAPPPEILAQMAHGLHSQFGWITAIVLFHGIVAEDRTRGFFRFYLAKPVSVTWFYGQAHLLAVLATATWSAGFIVMFSLAVHPAWNWGLVLNGLALGLLLGGLLFFFSTITGRDWLAALGVVLIAALTRARWPGADSSLGKVLDAVLPPTHLLGTSLTAGQWVWLGGWSLGLFALGLLILRRRPLGED
jgi:hypothetical protein